MHCIPDTTVPAYSVTGEVANFCYLFDLGEFGLRGGSSSLVDAVGIIRTPDCTGPLNG